MTLIAGLDINIWILFIAFVALFAMMIAINMVNKTVGLGYAWKLFQMTKKANKDKVLLKIFMPNGKPQYQIKEVGNLIEYTYKENGLEKDGMVKFDYYSMYRDFASIPVLECDPNDIVPRNPFLNTSLSIPGKIIKKNIVDSTKEDIGSLDTIKKYLKIALPLLIAFGVILILYSQGQSDALQQCYKLVGDTASQTAIIQAS